MRCVYTITISLLMQCVNMYSFVFLKVIFHQDKSSGYIVYIRQLKKLKMRSPHAFSSCIIHQSAICTTLNDSLTFDYAAAPFLRYLPCFLYFSRQPLFLYFFVISKWSRSPGSIKPAWNWSWRKQKRQEETALWFTVLIWYEYCRSLIFVLWIVYRSKCYIYNVTK